MQRTLNRYQSRFLLLAAAFAAVATLAAQAPRAHADHENNFAVAAIGAMIAFPTVGIPGIITAIHNGVYRNELTDGWRKAGYFFGAANILAGIVLPAISLSGPSSCSSGCVGLNLAWSLPPLINGALNLTFSALGKSPSMETRFGKLTVVPVTGIGAQNKVFGGVGLQLASF